MTQKEDAAEVARFKAALNQLIERIAEDRYVLAVVLVGSLSTETIWARETLGLWIIEADGVSRRLPSDGKDERIFRILVENGINIHAEVIPRSRFKKMVEGASRTAFSCNFFAMRQIVYSKDPVDRELVQEGQRVATRTRNANCSMFSTWTIHAHRHARKRLDIKGDLELAAQEMIWLPRTAWRTPKSSGGARCGNRMSFTGRWKGTRIFFRQSTRRALQAQESARALHGARRDRRISRRALPGSPETAARIISRSRTESCRCRRSATTSRSRRCTRGTWNRRANGWNAKDCCKKFPRRSS